MKEEIQLQVEAIKLFKEWSAWMVASELAVITFVGSSYFKDGSTPAVWLVLALACFAISAVAATWVLGALPWIVLNLNAEGFDNFYLAPLSSNFLLCYVRVWVMASVQHILFIIGLLFVAMGLLRVL